MSARDRQVWRDQLKLLTGVLGMEPKRLIDSWEQLCRIAAKGPLLGELWLERQRGAAQDVRDWLARLEEGDDA